MEYYPKSSIWKWIVIYVFIGVIVYGLIHQLLFTDNYPMVN